MGSVSPTQKLPNILIPDHVGFWTANTIITLPARTTSEALPAALATQVHYRLPLEQGTPLTPSPIVPYASLLISSLVTIPCLYSVEIILNTTCDHDLSESRFNSSAGVAAPLEDACMFSFQSLAG